MRNFVKEPGTIIALCLILAFGVAYADDYFDAATGSRIVAGATIKGFAPEFLIAINEGLIPGYELVHKFGRNAAAGTSKEDVMFGGGTLTPLTTAVTIEAISADAADTSAGANARTVTIWGVDSSFIEVSETITMTGTSASTATTQTFLRVFRARVVTTGTYNVANAGDITIRVSSAGATQLIIEAGTGVSQSTHYTIPAGKTAYVLRASLDIDSTKTARFILTERGNTNLTTAPFDPHKHVHTWDGVAANFEETFAANHKLLEKTDIWFESVAGSVSTPLEVDYDLLLVTN